MIENANRALQAQSFVHQFVLQEIKAFRKLYNIRKHMIKTLGRMLHEELIANGVFLLEGEIGIKMLGNGIEVQHRTDITKDEGLPIWQFLYHGAKQIRIKKNDTQNLLRVIAPFMETIVSKSGTEILKLVEEIEKEAEE
jgi:hypothetical protein